ncbi:MAG: hypothetical protein ACJAVV_003704 [Alphaproteobacteria bacterium]
MRLGTGCAHANNAKKNKGVTREKELKRQVKQTTKVVTMAVLAKLVYKKEMLQQQIVTPQPSFDISTI